jgi:hypothetical protein
MFQPDKALECVNAEVVSAARGEEDITGEPPELYGVRYLIPLAMI